MMRDDLIDSDAEASVIIRALVQFAEDPERSPNPEDRQTAWELVEKFEGDNRPPVADLVLK